MSGIWKGTRIAPDANDQLIWTLDESAPPFPNSGVWGAASLTASGSGQSYDQPGVFTTSDSARFNGTAGGKLKSPDSVCEINFPVTLSAWVNFVALTTYGIVITKSLSSSTWTTPYYTMLIALGNGTDGRWQAGINVGTGTYVGWSTIGDSDGKYRLETGIWHHLGISYDGANMKIYMNGQKIYSVAETRALYYTTGHGAWITGECSTTGNALNGYVDDIRFANVARSEQWFNDVWSKGLALDGHLLDGHGGANYYFDSDKYSRSASYDASEILGVGGSNYYDSGKYSRTPTFDAESWGLPGPGLMGATFYYAHRARRISTGTWHFWNHTYPDPTGFYSGVSPSDLQDITIIRTFTD